MRRYHDEISNETSDKVSDKKKKKLSGDGNHNDFIGGYLVHTDLLFDCNDVEKPQGGHGKPTCVAESAYGGKLRDGMAEHAVSQSIWEYSLYYGNGGFFHRYFRFYGRVCIGKDEDKMGDAVFPLFPRRANRAFPDEYRKPL